MSKQIPWKELRLSGELSLAEDLRKQYSTDASIYVQLPLAVAFPRDNDDVEKILEFCGKHNIPLHGWGAGTGRGGQCVGPGLIVQFRKHWQRIHSYNPETHEITVDPGVYYGEVQKYLRKLGRSFPPDPSYHQCTIAGMIANNAAGIHSVKYGGTIEHIAAIDYFTADGALHSTSISDTLSQTVENFVKKNEATIRADYPRVEKNSAGYSLLQCLTNTEHIDLAKLLCGSEGTLALFSKITLKTVPLPKATALGIVFFSSLENALRAAVDLRSYEIAACELVDRVLLDLHAENTKAVPVGPKHAKAIAHNPFLDQFYDRNAEAILIVEIEEATEATASQKLKVALESLRDLAIVSYLSLSNLETQQIWDLRRHSSPILNKVENGKITIKPLWAVEDVSLPKENFIPYVQEQKKIFSRFGLVCSFFGHAASCNLHIDPVSVDPRVAVQDAATAKLYDDVAKESYELVVRMGGSISGEHGDGFTRTPFLPLQYPHCYSLFAELKKLFDPLKILNPGKIVLERDLL